MPVGGGGEHNIHVYIRMCIQIDFNFRLYALFSFYVVLIYLIWHRQFLIFAHTGPHHSLHCPPLYAQNIPYLISSLHGLCPITDTNTIHMLSELSV